MEIKNNKVNDLLCHTSWLDIFISLLFRLDIIAVRLCHGTCLADKWLSFHSTFFLFGLMADWSVLWKEVVNEKDGMNKRSNFVFGGMFFFFFWVMEQRFRLRILIHWIVVVILQIADGNYYV